MHSRIYSFVYKHKLININQLHFCSKQSMEHALISLNYQKNLDNREAVCGVSVDL